MRILFVAFSNSVHTVRWVSQVADLGWDLHLYPSQTHAPVSPELEEYGTVYQPPEVKAPLHPAESLKWKHWYKAKEKVRSLISKLQPTATVRGLAEVIHRIQPDLVHSMEIQHGGYLCLATKMHMGAQFPPWLLGNWGSDIYLYHRIAEHQERLRQTLANCNFYLAECERDVKLARKLGLRASAQPVIPAAGGFDLAHWKHLRQSGLVSSRRTILLKGYQNWAGRALCGLRAIELCADLIRERNYRIVVPLAAEDLLSAVEAFTERTGIPVELPAHGPYSQAMRRFGEARVHIGLSISDGISQSLLESMVMGAFPIQSHTACADEWIRDGLSGLLVPPEDPQAIAVALRRVLTDDELVDRAAAINAETAEKRLGQATVRQKTITMYESIYSTIAAQHKKHKA